jgi:hypothetical protein
MDASDGSSAAEAQNVSVVNGSSMEARNDSIIAVARVRRRANMGMKQQKPAAGEKQMPLREMPSLEEDEKMVN